MAISAYKSSTTRRIFTNYPFKRGMLYDDLMITENASRAIVNLDIPSAGDYAQPRPAFVNAAIDTFYKVALSFPTNVIKQTTSLAKTFIIGFNNTVNEDNYINDVVVNNEDIVTRNYGVTILANEFAFEERERRDGIYLVESITDIVDGDTFALTYRDENNNVVPGFGSYSFRLLGIDTPERFPVSEPFADAALQFVLELLRPAHELEETYTIGDYEILNYYIQFEPATVSTDRTDSSRFLAYLLIELKNTANNDVVEIYTLTELLLKAGLGVMQADPDYIYYDRFKDAYDYAIENELGIHPLEVEEEVFDGNLDWDTLSNPVIDPVSPAEEIDIEYDNQNGVYYIEFEITNDTGEDVILIVEVGSNTFQEAVPDGELRSFNYTLFTDVDYKIRARFFPQTSEQQLNASQWTELELGRVSLNLDADILEDSLFEIIASIEYIDLNGAFNEGETITGTTSSATATVLDVQEGSAKIYIERTSGTTFTDDEEITGPNGSLTLVGNEVGQSGNSIDYIITNNLSYRLYIRATHDGDTLFSQFFEPNDNITDTYSNDDWDQFSDETQFITVYYETPAELGAIKSYTILVGHDIGGELPVISNADATGLDISFTVDNNNDFPVKVNYDFTSINETLSFNPKDIPANDSISITEEVDFYSTVYQISVYFSDPNDANLTSSPVSTNVTTDVEPEAVVATFNSNGGTPNYASVSGTPPLTVNYPGGVSKTGYNFTGWNNGLGTSGSTTITANTTFTAQFSIKQYTITWDPNGGTWTDNNNSSNRTTTVNHGNTPTQPSSLGRSDYTFDRWSPTIVAATGNATYEAQWTSTGPVPDVTATFNSNEGSPSYSSITNEGSFYVTSPGSPSRTGYSFTGWSPSLPREIDEDTQFTAQWSANEYMVTLNNTEGSGGSTSVEVTYGFSMPSISLPTRSGYNFTGYYTSTSGGTKYYNSNGSSARNWNQASGDTLYAQWESTTSSPMFYTLEAEANPNGISITVNGSSTTHYNQSLESGTSVTVSANSTVTYSGNEYEFVSWRTSSGSIITTNTTTSFTMNSNKTYIAHYEEAPEPVETVELEARVVGGASSVSITVNSVSKSVTSSGTVIDTKDENTTKSVSLSAPAVFVSGSTTYTFVKWRTSFGSTLSTNTNYTYNWGSSTGDTQIVVEYEIGSQFG